MIHYESYYLRVSYLFAHRPKPTKNFLSVIFCSPCVKLRRHSYDVLVLLLHTYIQYALVLQALGSQFCQAAAAAAQRLIRSPFNPTLFVPFKSTTANSSNSNVINRITSHCYRCHRRRHSCLCCKIRECRGSCCKITLIGLTARCSCRCRATAIIIIIIIIMHCHSTRNKSSDPWNCSLTS